jgi:2-hydroxychromene-2-carboxylate isomerase
MRFFFDFISPYAYLGWTQIHALAARHDRDVEPVPVLFAALLDAHGTLGPAEIPAKRRYIFHDVARTAQRLGVAIAPPPAHPFNPLLALRVASLSMDPGERRDLIDRLFAAIWAGGAGVTDPGEVARLASAAGLDGEALVAAAATSDAKDRVRRNTEAALAAGVFGVPTVQADGELFWGLDSFANLESYLDGGLRLDPALVARWNDLPAAATRKLPAPR